MKKRYPTSDLEQADFPIREERKYVMIRFDRDPSLSYRVQNYTESVSSEKLRFRGEVVPAIYPKTKYLRERAWKMGRKDITEDIGDDYWRVEDWSVKGACLPLLEKSPSLIRNALKNGEVDEHLESLFAFEEEGQARAGVLRSISKRINDTQQA